MDAGIAITAWLKERDYRYLVVSRERGRQFDPDHAITTLTANSSSGNF